MYNTDNNLLKMFVQYRDMNGFLINGTFDEVPENACGAHIGISFPMIEADGVFRTQGSACVYYELYVGEVFDANVLLERISNSANITSEGVVVAMKEVLKGNMTVVTVSEAMKQRIIEYSKLGVTSVVFTKFGVMPLNKGDSAFTTREEMVAAIDKINQTYKSISFSVQYADTKRL